MSLCKSFQMSDGDFQSCFFFNSRSGKSVGFLIASSVLLQNRSIDVEIVQGKYCVYRSYSFFSCGSERWYEPLYGYKDLLAQTQHIVGNRTFFQSNLTRFPAISMTNTIRVTSDVNFK